MRKDPVLCELLKLLLLAPAVMNVTTAGGGLPVAVT